MASKRTIVFSDFDGTITTKDSFLVFLRYYLSPPQFWLGAIVLSPILIGQKLGLIQNGRAKEMVMTYFFKRESVATFEKRARQFSIEQIEKILIPKGIEKLLWHKSQNHQVTIVSASFEAYLESWCALNGFEYLATKLKSEHGLLTGKYEGSNCYGQEKVRRINAKYNLEEYDEIIGYGDTKGDLPMLEICNSAHYKFFNK